MTGSILCGGWATKYSCMFYESGDWNTFSWSLKQPRYAHVAWKRPDGALQIMGGQDGASVQTSEVVTMSGSIEGFNLKYRAE